jgi:hypothetical protein
MKQQRGFILPFALPALSAVLPYIAIAAAVAFIGLGAALKVQTMRLHSAQTNLAAEQLAFKTFKRQVAALGELAQRDAAVHAAADRLLKEQADVEHNKVVLKLSADIKRLRDERDGARGSIVPAAPASAGRPDLACFDRGTLESAFRGFIAEARGLADEGTAATVDLNTAKQWAQP